MRLASLLVISVFSSMIESSYALPLKPRAPPKQPAVRRRVAYSVVAVDGDSAVTSPAAPVSDTVTIIQTSDSIETVTIPASSTPPSIETSIATKMVTEMEPAKTVDIILTQDVTKTPSPTTSSSYIVVNPAETPTSSSTVLLTSQTSTGVPTENCVTSFSTSTPTLSSTSTWTSTPTIFMPSASSSRLSEATHPAEAKEAEAEDPEAIASIPSRPRPPPPSSPPHPAITILSTLPTASTKTYDDGMWHTSYPLWNATSTVLSSASATVVSHGRAQKLWKNG